MKICAENKRNLLSYDKIIKSVKTNNAKNIIIKNNSNKDNDLNYKKYSIENILKLFVTNC